MSIIIIIIKFMLIGVRGHWLRKIKEENFV
jgi:hypothetical protein